MVFKREIANEKNQGESKQAAYEDLSVLETYNVAWKIVCLKPIHKIIFCLFTLRIGLATESMSFMKIVEQGVPKEKIGLLAVPLSPLQILIPFAISRLLNGNSPFKYFKYAVMFRLTMVLVNAGWVYVTPQFKFENNEFSFAYFFVTMILQALHSISIYGSYIPVMFFFSQISDKNFGGTYLTFLNTVSNLSRNWVNTGSLYLANFLSSKHCVFNELKFEQNINSSNLTDILNEVHTNFCASEDESKACVGSGGSCDVYFDPYYTQTVVCIIFGTCWVIWISRILTNLEKLPKSDFKIHQDKIKLRTE